MYMLLSDEIFITYSYFATYLFYYIIYAGYIPELAI